MDGGHRDQRALMAVKQALHCAQSRVDGLDPHEPHSVLPTYAGGDSDSARLANSLSAEGQASQAAQLVSHWEHLLDQAKLRGDQAEVDNLQGWIEQARKDPAIAARLDGTYEAPAISEDAPHSTGSQVFKDARDEILERSEREQLDRDAEILKRYNERIASEAET